MERYIGMLIVCNVGAAKSLGIVFDEQTLRPKGRADASCGCKGRPLKYTHSAAPKHNSECMIWRGGHKDPEADGLYLLPYNEKKGAA